MGDAVKLLLLCFLLFVAQISAATYFVDFDGGADANNGTSTATAWKRIKGMANVAGTAASATIAAGDTVVFKGGVTWTTSVPFALSSSGTPASKIFYTTNGAWGSGLAVIDAAFADLGSGASGGMVTVARSNIVLCGISMVNMRLNTNNNQGAIVTSSLDFEMTNCVVGPWRYGATDGVVPVGTDFGLCGGLAYDFAALTGVRGVGVSGCTFHQTGINNKFGSAITGGCSGYSNVVMDCASGVRAGAHYGTRFLNVGTPSDTAAHTDVFTTQNTGNLDGCLLSNITTGAGIQFQNISGVGNAFTNKVRNCIVLQCTPAPIEIHTINAGFSFEFCNNTLVGSTGILISDHGGNPVLRLVAQNNNLISSGPGIFTGSGLVTTIVSDHNLTNSSATASAYGATLANHYRPTVYPSAPIDGGADLAAMFTVDFDGITRPKLAAFDIGAFEFVVPAPPAMTLGSGMTLGNGMTVR